MEFLPGKRPLKIIGILNLVGYYGRMCTISAHEILSLPDEAILAQCDIHIYKASGPGGQHRNKVSSAVRLRHKETGITATANDSRSQHSNRKLALQRMRMNIALRLRSPLAPTGDEPNLPEILAECIHVATKGPQAGSARLTIGRKNHRFWLVAAYLLDILTGAEGKVAQAAEMLGITTGNLTSVLKSDRHLIAAVQEIRKSHNMRPIS